MEITALLLAQALRERAERAEARVAELEQAMAELKRVRGAAVLLLNCAQADGHGIPDRLHQGCGLCASIDEARVALLQ